MQAVRARWSHLQTEKKTTNMAVGPMYAQKTQMRHRTCAPARVDLHSCVTLCASTFHVSNNDALRADPSYKRQLEGLSLVKRTAPFNHYAHRHAMTPCFRAQLSSASPAGRVTTPTPQVNPCPSQNATLLDGLDDLVFGIPFRSLVAVPPIRVQHCPSSKMSLLVKTKRKRT